MNDMPWTESATLVRLGKRSHDAEAQILFEGTLEQIARRVANFAVSDRVKLRVSLPDRMVRPHTFEGSTLDALVDKVELKRA